MAASLMTSLTLSPAELRFRSEVRAFLETEISAEIQRATRLSVTYFPDFKTERAWHRALARRGWAAPAWPEKYGGPGWSLIQRYIFDAECARAGAPAFNSPVGIHLVGPTLMRFGSDAQKMELLPRILSGQDYWCQGFSEPGAGSDLASLKTTAVRVGDRYVINGTKIWTSQAQHANRMLTLVRTAQGGKPQAGISCLIVDMQAPGVTVRPIFTIGGDHELNQVFLDDVEVPSASRVGAEGEGWACAKYLLEFERGASFTASRLRQRLRELIERANEQALEDALDARLAELAIDIDALEVMELSLIRSDDVAPPSAVSASVIKLAASRLEQAVATLALDAADDNALHWEPTRPLHIVDQACEDLPVRAIVPRYLNSRASTVFGGTSEIQLSLMARALFGH
jgi:acyl-CoA dehydrogenase